MYNFAFEKPTNMQAEPKPYKLPPINYIGIDPSFRKDGFAVCVIDTDNTAAFTIMKGGLLQFISWILHDAPEDAIVVVENSNLQNITFDMSGSKLVVAAKSRNVGMNQAASEYTYQICKFRYKDNAHQVSPREKGAKRGNDTVQYLAKHYGHTLQNYKGQASEQDKRDAYILACMGLNYKIKG